MLIKNIKFFIALIAPLIYELVMIIFSLDGLSLPKLLLTVLVWLSFAFAFNLFLKNFRLLKRNIPNSTYILLVLLLIWNILCILRSFLENTGEITTLLGNTSTGLALLVPFAIIFSLYNINLRIINRYFLGLLKIGLFVFLIMLSLYRTSLPDTQAKVLIALLFPCVFLITVIVFEKRKTKYFTMLCCIALFYVAFQFGSRTMLVREFMLVICAFLIYIYRKYTNKWILRLSFLGLLIPFILLQQSVVSGDSAIGTYFSENLDSDSSLSTDTRTFLYTELYEDLVISDQLITGKGANGTYYSDYFSTAEGDSDTRLSVEVGVLAMLLKGGLVAVVLNLLLLFIAIYHAFFQSNNYYIMGLGFILFIHTLLLFIENLLLYSSYNFIIWFLIGVCLSKNLRGMHNMEILRILRATTKKNHVPAAN